MSVLTQLASALGHRDEKPNQALARRIAGDGDVEAVAELVAALSSKKKAIQSDCIKTLYEVAELDPSLVAPFVSVFTGLLTSRHNRLVWGAMMALDKVTPLRQAEVFAALTHVMAAAEKGTVITNDHAVGILVGLAKEAAYRERVMPFLMERIEAAPANQLPTYAEKALAVVGAEQAARFRQVLRSRLADLEPGPKRTRLDKVLAKAAKL